MNMKDIINTSQKANKFKMYTYHFHLNIQQVLTDKLIETSIKNFFTERVLKYKNLTDQRSSHKHLILCYRALAADSTIF